MSNKQNMDSILMTTVIEEIWLSRVPIAGNQTCPFFSSNLCFMLQICLFTRTLNPFFLTGLSTGSFALNHNRLRACSFSVNGTQPFNLVHLRMRASCGTLCSSRWPPVHANWYLLAPRRDFVQPRARTARLFAAECVRSSRGLDEVNLLLKANPSQAKKNKSQFTRIQNFD